jgi:hypothetical protein
MALSLGGGCMSVTPQLKPTDYSHLETIDDRGEREEAYAEQAIYKHQLPQGMRYTKGTSPSAEKRSWQSLDAILRSDRHSAAALPNKPLRLSRLFTALTIVSGILMVAGTAASAREGLDLGELNGTGGLLLGSGLATLGFGITAGVFYGKTKKGYEKAVDVYNDSLGMRLGLYTPKGEYIPPRGALVDEEGFVVLDSAEEVEPEPQPQPQPAPPATTPEPAPSETQTEPEAQPGESDPAAPLERAPESVEPPAASVPAPKKTETAPDGPQPGVARIQGISLSPRSAAL